MKMTILLALSLLSVSAIGTLLNSPQLLPVSAWDRPAPAGMLSDEDLKEMNREFSHPFTNEPNVQRAYQKVFAPAPVVTTEAGSRDSFQPVRAAKPIMLAQAVTPAPPEPPAKPEDPAEPATPATPALQRTLEEMQHEADRNQRQAEKQETEAKRTYARAVANYDESFQPVMRMATAGSSGRNLIIRSSETDPKSLAAAEEDLSVMGRILAKAAAKTGEDEEKTALGVHISSFGSGVKNFEIEGYGAIFLLKANFPLAGPSAKAEEEKPKEPGNSTWEETKTELYGSHNGPGNKPQLPLPHMRSTVEYDPKRVEQLETSLLEAMKNAGNIRALKDGETVTVVVTSGGDGGNLWQVDPFVVSNSSGGGGSYSYSWSSSGSSGESGSRHSGKTLTIRTKKSDIDNFFHGKLNLEEFRRKATIALY